jgi:hypothetical protein
VRKEERAMFTDLKRCVRCHQRYPEPLGHRCPLTALSNGREEDFEQAFRTWLGSKEGQFAEYLARRQQTASA